VTTSEDGTEVLKPKKVLKRKRKVIPLQANKNSWRTTPQIPTEQQRSAAAENCAFTELKILMQCKPNALHFCLPISQLNTALRKI